MRITVWITLVVAATVAACAANPKPGEPGYPYNVSGAYASTFMVEGSPYTGTTTLATAPGGAVTGTMNLTSPAPITSSVTGTVTADSLKLTIPYTSPDNCTGTAYLNGTVGEGGAQATGDMVVDDSCGGNLLGTFTLIR